MSYLPKETGASKDLIFFDMFFDIQGEENMEVKVFLYF